MKNKRALYLRCSTDMQEMSIPDQRKVLQKYCVEKGYEIVEEFQDEGISGTTFEKRPGAMRLFQKVQSGHHDFSGVVILNESRFGRAPNTKETFHYEYLLEKAGVYVEYVQSESNMPGAPGLIMRAVKYEQAAEFSKQLSKDVIRGHSTAAEKGYSTGGFPPIGYARMVCDEGGKELFTLEPGQRKAVKNHWVKWVPGDPTQIALVNRMFLLYAEGSKGLRAICNVLNDEKIHSPKGGKWGIDAVRSIIINRAYIGERVYGGKWSKKVQNKVVCKNAHEAIVPVELFEKVQALMKSRDFGMCNGMRTDYLLSGKIVCMKCGHKFQGRKVRNKAGTIYNYYMDSGFKNYHVCQSLNILKNTKGDVVGLEDFVLSVIQKMLEGDRYVERFKEHLKETLISLEWEIQTTYPALNKKLKAVDTEIIKIQDALIFTGSRSKSLAERLVAAETEREVLKKELAKFEGVKRQPSKVLLLVNEYAKTLMNVGEILKKRSAGEQKTAISYFLDRIEVLREERVARCYFYDTPRFREIDYKLPASPAGSSVPQNGAEGGTRTPMGCPTRPSNVRVYQFHHFGTCEKLLLQRRLLSRNVGEPFFVFVVASVNDVEERGLQLLGHRPRLAPADGPVVHFPDGRDLGGRTGKERFVGNIQFVAGEPLFHDPHTAFSGELHDRFPRDAFQDRGERRGLDHALAHHKNIFAAAFRHVAVGIEQHGFVISVLQRLALCKQRVCVVRRGL